jgi:PAS domain S-box-containing protein
VPELLNSIAEDYKDALAAYLNGGGKAILKRGYEIGRHAIATGARVQDIIAIHQQCLDSLVFSGRIQYTDIPSRAAGFIVECLAPYETVLRRFAETNNRLQRSLIELSLARDQLRDQNEVTAEAHRALDAERRRYCELFEFAPDAYITTDLDGVIHEANSTAADLFHTSCVKLAGVCLLDFVVPDEQPWFAARLSSCKQHVLERTEEFQVSLQVGVTQTIPAAVTVGAERDSDGTLSGLRWLIRDITEQKRAEQEKVQFMLGHAETQAALRFRFLAEASVALTRTVDYETSLERVARLAVPLLADWCFIYLFKPDGYIRQLEAAGADGFALGSGPDIAELRLRRGGLRSELLRSILSVEIVDELDDEWISALAGNAERFDLFRLLAPRCALIVPWAAGDHPAGVLCLLRTRAGVRYTKNDLWVGEDLAHRCALGAENAELYVQIREERDRAERANRAKDEFLAILSHELRNPLTPVLGWARSLQNHRSIVEDSVLLEGARALERNARQLARLVDDCLDMARISRGGFQIEIKPVDVNQLILGAHEALRDSVLSAELEFTLELAPAPLWVMGDTMRMQQVLLNLLGNAIKYTESGGHVLVRSSASNGFVQIEVRDTGVGIDSQLIEQIFEPFRQGNQRLISFGNGLGLGLAIAKRIVELHRGSIAAESLGTGCGSRFYFRLPQTQAPAMERTPVAAVPTAGGHAEQILCVEDARDILFLLRVELEMLGYSVMTAESGELALEMAQQQRPEVVISDIKMPTMDGCEFLRRMRKIDGLADVPAIALTGLGVFRDHQRAIAAGFDLCLTKPLEIQELHVHIKRLLKQRCAANGRPSSQRPA